MVVVLTALAVACADLRSGHAVPEVAPGVAGHGAKRRVPFGVESELAVAVRVRDAEHAGPDRDDHQLARWAALKGKKGPQKRHISPLADFQRGQEKAAAPYC